MSPEIQEWLAAVIVLCVAGAALWQRWTRQKTGGCNECSARQCPGVIDRTPGDDPIADPYRPRIYRPQD